MHGDDAVKQPKKERYGRSNKIKKRRCEVEEMERRGRKTLESATNRQKQSHNALRVRKLAHAPR